MREVSFSLSFPFLCPPKFLSWSILDMYSFIHFYFGLCAQGLKFTRQVLSLQVYLQPSLL
jgi:hypothetical protein